MAQKTSVLKKKIGVRDLARLASVDASTVSRALNHDSRINDARAKMIRDLAERHGYRPRPLRSKFARSVGLLFRCFKPGVLDQFQERIAWLAQRTLGERRLHMNLECLVEDPLAQTPAAVPELVKQNRVDGVVLVGSPSVQLVRDIRSLDMPAVAINDTVDRLGITCVRSDPSRAIHEAVLNLAARGHQRFGILMKHMNYPTAQVKYDSYVHSLRTIGIELDPAAFVTDLVEDLSGGREGIRQLMSRGPLPTAILCENDWLALSAINELQRIGRRVPRDVSVMGHDDVWICRQSEPPITSVRRSEEELVKQVIDLLLEQIEKGPQTPRDVRVEGEMVWRESTDAAPDRARESQ